MLTAAQQLEVAASNLADGCQDTHSQLDAGQSGGAGS